MRANLAFSLIELMVVGAIVGILAAITLPTYEKNSSKAKVSTSISVLEGLTRQVMMSYSTHGKIPETLEGASGDSGGSYVSYVVPNVTTHLHYDNGSTWTNVGALVEISLPNNIGKGIPNYVVSTDGSNGSYNTIAMAFYEDHGTLKVYCGIWDSTSTRYIPSDVLPAGCNTSNFRSIVTGQ